MLTKHEIIELRAMAIATPEIWKKILEELEALHETDLKSQARQAMHRYREKAKATILVDCKAFIENVQKPKIDTYKFMEVLEKASTDFEGRIHSEHFAKRVLGDLGCFDCDNDVCTMNCEPAISSVQKQGGKMTDIELIYSNFIDKHCKTNPEFPTALEAFQAAYNLREQEVQKLTLFAKWAFEQASEGMDVDGGDIQEKLNRLGLIEERAVNPDDNEYGSDTLYFWKEQALNQFSDLENVKQETTKE